MTRLRRNIFYNAAITKIGFKYIRPIDIKPLGLFNIGVEIYIWDINNNFDTNIKT